MPVPSRPLVQGLRALLPPLATALAYALSAGSRCGWPCRPPTHRRCTLSAGIALVCVLRFGWPALAGVAVAAFGVAALASPPSGQQAGAAQAAAFALAAAVQAGVGTVLVRRFLPGPLTLAEPRDMAVFFGLGALLACLVGSTLAIATLGWSQALPREALLVAWWTAWSGDALGVLIGAPIALTLIGVPSSAWTARRLTVGLPLLVVTLLMALALEQVARWDDTRSRALFEREANNASSLLTAHLEQALIALQVVHAVYGASPAATPDTLRRAVRDWLADESAQQALSHGVWSAGFAEWRDRSSIGQPERRQPIGVADGWRPLDAQSAADAATAMARTGGGDPASRAATRQRRRGRPESSVARRDAGCDRSCPPHRPTGRQRGLPAAADGPADETAVGLVHALYRDRPTTMDERLAATTGLVFVTLRPQELLREMRGSVPAFLELCVIDTDPRAERRVLAGAADCMRPGAGYAAAGAQPGLRRARLGHPGERKAPCGGGRRARRLAPVLARRAARGRACSARCC